MITSIAMLDYASKKVKEYRAKQRENFETSSGGQSQDGESLKAMDGIEDGIAYLIQILSITFFVFELIVMVYAVKHAITCSEPGMNRVAHIFMAIFFTVPYTLLSLFFSPCIKKM